MSGFTDSRNSDTHALPRFNQAIDAFDRGELEFSELCRKALESCEQAGQDEVSVVCGRLGGIAYRRGDFDAAEQWYRKSLGIDERTGNEHGAATTCHYLSFVADGRADSESAENWLWKSIHIKEKQGDEIGAAESYHQLGFVAYCRQDFDAAERWYLKSLEIEEKLDNEIGMAETYFNLSANARGQDNNKAAEEWLGKALQIFERKGSAKWTLQAARIAGQAREFGVAEKTCRKALEIAKKNGDDMCEAHSYQHLGSFAWQQGDYEASKQWYEKAFEAHEKRGAMDEAAKMCIALAHLSFAAIAGKPRDFHSAAWWFRKSLEIDDHVTWRKRLTLYARLWHYRFLSFFSK